jgi:hypothetical protein
VASAKDRRTGYSSGMCRSIKTLRRADEPATDDEVRAAALQFVRKVSGFRAPSQRNAEAFDAAVDEIATASQRLLDAMEAARTAPRAIRTA